MRLFNPNEDTQNETAPDVVLPVETISEPNRVKDSLVLFGSLVFLYLNELFTRANIPSRGLMNSLAFAFGATIAQALIAALLYLIARAFTKRSGRWHLLYLGLLLMYLILSPMLQRYGTGGSFFGK